MIIDFTIEDLLLDSYLQKNFHTPEIANNIKNETLDNIYNFDDDLIYFGY